MIVRFAVTNYLSFCEKTEFIMLPSSSVKKHPKHLHKCTKDIKLLKGTSIYGYNASGKSNFIRCISFLQHIIKTGKINDNLSQNKFLLKKGNNLKPIDFELELLIDKEVYKYSLSLDNKDAGNYVKKEELCKLDKEGNSVAPSIFSRECIDLDKKETKIEIGNKGIPDLTKLLIEDMKKGERLGLDELLLSNNEKLLIEELEQFRKRVVEKILIIHPESKPFKLVSQFHTWKKTFNDMLQLLPLGINQLGIKETEFSDFFGEKDNKLKESIIKDLDKDSKAPAIVGFLYPHHYFVKKEDKYLVERLVFKHLDDGGKPIDFNLEQESDGTQRLIDLMPALDMVLKDDITCIVDEIDQSLHPPLLKKLISEIMQNEKMKGQLIFTTHQLTLLDLDIFRRDEIWFVRKDRSQASEMYSLSEFKESYGEGKDKKKLEDINIEEAYKIGRFGALPLGDF